jgi:hypothetical protein
MSYVVLCGVVSCGFFWHVSKRVSVLLPKNHKLVFFWYLNPINNMEIPNDSPAPDTGPRFVLVSKQELRELRDLKSEDDESIFFESLVSEVTKRARPTDKVPVFEVCMCIPIENYTSTIEETIELIILEYALLTKTTTNDVSACITIYSRNKTKVEIARLRLVQVARKVYTDKLSEPFPFYIIEPIDQDRWIHGFKPYSMDMCLPARHINKSIEEEIDNIALEFQVKIRIYTPSEHFKSISIMSLIEKSVAEARDRVIKLVKDDVGNNFFTRQVVNN